MKKNTKITIAIILVCVILAVACIFIFNGETSILNLGKPKIEDGPINWSDTSPENVEAILLDSFVQAKEALGKEYYPTESMSEAEIVELFNINPEDYTHAVGQRCKNGKLDILVSIKAVDLEASERIQHAYTDYINGLIANTSIPEHIRHGLDGVFTYYDTTWGYVYLVATLGDIDSIKNQSHDELAAYVEHNSIKTIEYITHVNDGEGSATIISDDDIHNEDNIVVE